MKEIKLTKTNRVMVLQQALEVLRAGGAVIYPTETSYGLGVDFYNQEAVDRIYKIKNRDRSKPLPVIVPDIVSASSIVNFSDKAKRLATHWPGPLTLVLPFKYCKWSGHCDDFLALRVSNHPFANDLVSIFGKPVVSTSANLSDTGNSYDPAKIKEQFSKSEFKPDLLIDAGVLPPHLPSTIVKIEGDKIEILRQGDLKIEI